jgi:hypothetical protein
VFTTGPPITAWTSPHQTVLQFTNGRLQFDDNRHYASHNPYYAQWPYPWMYHQVFGWGW